ncbi:MAG: Hsp20/alpha crystallin family protein [Bacteroidales bacterium]|nr:Hsp20/alpha crystallin family protein [Bacteroidales bacterium]
MRTSWPGLIDGYFNDNFLPDVFNTEKSQNMPAVNISEGNDDYRIEVAAPGLGKEDFKVSFDNGVLTVSSEKEVNNESKEENVLRKEFSYSSFCRSFRLPDTVNGDKIKATYSDGILNIVVPKKEEAKVKPVREIKIS